MSLLNYKCPSCGASINYDASQDKSVCDFCNSVFTLKELDDYAKKSEKKEKPASEKDSQEEILSYSCDNCGAEVVSDATTSATFCYYCHSPVILTKQLQGDFKPDYIVPFAIDKKKAQETFLNWAKTKPYVPRSFTEASQLEKITGMYLPYWMGNAKTHVNVQGVGTKTRVYTQGDTEYTEHQDYPITAQGDFTIEKIPELAFTQIDRDLVKSVDDFSDAELREFNMLYLSGFFSERYDIERQKAESSLIEQAENYAQNFVRSQFSGYDNIKKDVDEVNTELEKVSYVLLPTWVLTYNYLGKNYVYMLNGVNGRAYGELPLDQKKLALRSGIIFLIIMALALLGGRFLW